MTVDPSRSLKHFARLAACLAALALASCGGGVSAPTSPVVNDTAISLLPGAGTILYSGLPTTFILSGGTGAYIVTSSDQAIIPIAGGVTGRSVTVVPNPVVTETTVTLTARDTGAATPVVAVVTVRPGTVNNSITITPNPQQSSSCNPAICSGGDADVRVTISQGGIPLAARGIRFDVISGDFRVIVTPPGVVPEQTALSQLVATDETGVARVRIRANVLSANQTALLQITEVASGAYRFTSFAIAQFTGNSPAYFVLPSAITFTGPATNVCAGGATTDIAIFGGTPPYAITSGGSAFTVSPTVVTDRGGKFTITLPPAPQLPATPACFTDLPIGVTDSTGRTITVTVTNKGGTGTAPAPAIVLSPTTAPLGCGESVTFSIIGGTPPFSFGANHPRIALVNAASAGLRSVTVTRLRPDSLPLTPYSTSAVISVTDGVPPIGQASVTNMPANCN